MTALERISHLDRAEDYLELFGIEVDPGLLERARLPILRQWAREIEQIDRNPSALGEEERLALYGEALRRALDRISRGQPTPARSGCIGCTLTRCGEGVSDEGTGRSP
jgi:hypothetical protein